ncbi:MAG: flagellar motor protein [Candidatus Dactylopiibacterium carminicum]|uniref:Flagellar motor protein n=1 Tax=Candidatus Dactylopiibacterium carminicum TaxID=857335 RepID=A0A272EV67_9RHOO|nr:flagellar motor protein [Candidatus Dactylopiibacterium carminicum]KAF7599662.1 flagellar motor protein [Candidatus Dactylopiibacterium carminicum]PAS93560.1 MAG: flagellar motor protein [Candidatus Dactylopiibacterium carminicum]PAS97447.1 MAG: flagellar motor protein [Candidatus Dactylopiibacterium carminicum]PAS99662.1 MAG: flagellar motor protein [Candidatus Dactylopiibacterium carminicum]
MDIISVVGLALGLAAILVGQVLEGGHISSLVQPTAFLIVIGGTVGAVMLQSPWRAFRRGVTMVGWVFSPPVLNKPALIAQMVTWSTTARKEGLLALESRIDMLDDPFLRKGLQLLVDGVDPEHIREVLEVEIAIWEADLKQATRIWEAAGGYAPTIGILGAVMGLIHVMENLSDPSKLGAGIAVAFVATIYGVGSANLVFLPVAKKLQAHVAQLVAMREMMVDGLISISHGDNPRLIENRLQGYVL